MSQSSTSERSPDTPSDDPSSFENRPRGRNRSESVDLYDSREGVKEGVWETLPDGRRVMEAGCFQDLVSWLLIPDCDTPLQHEFLFCYHYFSTPQNLAKELGSMFTDPLSGQWPVLVNEYQEEASQAKQLTPEVQIRLRILNVIKIWVNYAWTDFVNVPSLSATVLAILKEAKASEEMMVVATAKNIKRALRANEKTPPSLGLPAGFEIGPTPALRRSMRERDSKIVPDGLHTIPGLVEFFSFPPGELARQFTLCEMGIYRQIENREILFHKWQTEPDKAPNVKALINQFNEVSAWSRTLILSGDDSSFRIQILRRLIDLAEELFNLNNFNTLFALMAGIQSFPVKRLKPLWEKLPKQSMQKFQDLSGVVNVQGNFSNFRTIIARIDVDKPCLPHLGRYLAELIMIEEGNSNEVEGMINYGKFRMIGQLIRQLKKYQDVNYEFEPDGDIQKFIANLHHWDEETCYARSMSISGKTVEVASNQLEKYITMKRRNENHLGTEKDGPLVRINAAFAGVSASANVSSFTPSDSIINFLATTFCFSHYNDGSLRICEPPDQGFSGTVIPLGKPIRKAASQTVPLEIWRNPVLVKVSIFREGITIRSHPIILSYDMPLHQQLSHFHRAGGFSSRKIFSFQVHHLGVSSFVSTHLSLRDLKFEVENDSLILYLHTPSLAVSGKGVFAQKVIYQWRRPGTKLFLHRRKAQVMIQDNLVWFVQKKVQPQLIPGDYYNSILILDGKRAIVQMTVNTDAFLGLPEQFLIFPTSVSHAQKLIERLEQLGCCRAQMEGPITVAGQSEKMWFSLRQHRPVLSWISKPTLLHNGQPFTDSLELGDCQLLFSENPKDLHATLKGPKKILQLSFDTVEQRQRWLHAFYFHGLPSNPDIHLPQSINPMFTKLKWVSSQLPFPLDRPTSASAPSRKIAAMKKPQHRSRSTLSDEPAWFTVEFVNEDGSVKTKEIEYDADVVVNSVRQKFCSRYNVDYRKWQIVVDGVRLPSNTPFSELSSQLIRIEPRKRDKSEKSEHRSENRS